VESWKNLSLESTLINEKNVLFLHVNQFFLELFYSFRNKLGLFAEMVGVVQTGTLALDNLALAVVDLELAPSGVGWNPATHCLVETLMPACRQTVDQFKVHDPMRSHQNPSMALSGGGSSHI